MCKILIVKCEYQTKRKKNTERNDVQDKINNETYNSVYALCENENSLYEK